MTRTDFEYLRDLPGKRIEADIRFGQDPHVSTLLTFDRVPIFNEAGFPAYLNGTYRTKFKAFTFNVRVEGVGPICRVCVNSSAHGNAGRHHKHSLHDENCPRANLGRDVVPRNDLVGKTAREVFEDFCRRAQIEHTGRFFDPEGP